MSLPDPRAFSAADRAALAWAAHQTPDFDALGRWPVLDWFNDAPCPAHAPDPGPWCPRCGLAPRRHQKTGAAWMFLAGRTLLADTVGSGKTLQAALVLAMCKQTGELGPHSRAVIICKAAAVRDPWAAALARLLPAVPVLVADGPPARRQAGYLSPWEICVVSDRTFAPAGRPGARGSRGGDAETLREFPVGAVIYDDIDPMRNRGTATARAVRALAAAAPRVHGIHGTPLQKKLRELYGNLEPAGAAAVFGTEAEFCERYVSRRRQLLNVPVRSAWPRERQDWARARGYPSYEALSAAAAADRAAGRPGPARALAAAVSAGQARVRRVVWADSGVNADRLPEFRRLAAPLVLRRTAADLDDVELPAVQVNQVWVDLAPAQRARYEELRRGVLKRLRDGAEQVTQAEAGARFTRGAQICSGLAALDDGADVSAKLDYVMDLLTGDLSEDKAVVYVHYRPNVAALSARLSAAGTGHVLFWSAETDPRVREARRLKFLNDPACRVLVGTTAIEQSLNLQAAGHLIAVDTVMNAARMEQMVGRIRRQGSAHRTVFLHHLLARGTQEDGYPALLRAEAEMADGVWGEAGAVFSALTPRQMLSLVATGHAGPPAP